MISSDILFQIFFWLLVTGVVTTILIPERWCPNVLAWFGSVAALALLLSAGTVLLGGDTFRFSLWTIPVLGTLELSLDKLSALFLVVTALIFLPVSVFSSGYLKHYLGHYSLKVFNIWYLSLFLSIGLILFASDVLMFLLAWEAMSILSYLLVNFEHRDEEHTAAGYLMLAMGEAGTLAAAIALLLLAIPADSLSFPALKSTSRGMSEGLQWAIFLLSFFGFGVKAGLAPFNAWLPRAHPVAPGNISALLSSVILNLGLYGIVRINMDILPMTMTGPGLITLIIGTVSAFVGILYATTKNDLKVMLAHSSIENIGIVTAGLGAGFVFTATGHTLIATIAFVAAFYHMANHSFYKALLFLSAATVDMKVGVRHLDQLGGLIRRMPLTALCFLAGALSISALPPFNGFVSEWLTLQTMLRSAELSSVSVKVVFALCGAILALTAALAVTCFVKAFAMGFLGISRSAHAEKTTEAARSMTSPMVVLMVFCLLLGVLPTFVISALDGVLKPITQASAVEALTPPFFATSPDHIKLKPEFAAEFRDLGAQVGQEVFPGQGLVVMHRGGEHNPVVFAMSTSYMFPVLIILLAIVFVVVRFGLARDRCVIRNQRWDGGIRRLLPEMTYTATGFSNPVRVIFDTILRPTTQDTQATVEAHFRAAIRRRREEVHIVDRSVITPLRSGALKIAYALAAMHHGRLNAYVGYGLLTLVLSLVLVLTVAG